MKQVRQPFINFSFNIVESVGLFLSRLIVRDRYGCVCVCVCVCGDDDDVCVYLCMFDYNLCMYMYVTALYQSIIFIQSNNLEVRYKLYKQIMIYHKKQEHYIHMYVNNTITYLINLKERL